MVKLPNGFTKAISWPKEWFSFLNTWVGHTELWKLSCGLFLWGYQKEIVTIWYSNVCYIVLSLSFLMCESAINMLWLDERLRVYKKDANVIDCINCNNIPLKRNVSFLNEMHKIVKRWYLFKKWIRSLYIWIIY